MSMRRMAVGVNSGIKASTRTAGALCQLVHYCIMHEHLEAAEKTRDCMVLRAHGEIPALVAFAVADVPAGKGEFPS